jgi:hypothetical protein
MSKHIRIKEQAYTHQGASIYASMSKHIRINEQAYTHQGASIQAASYVDVPLMPVNAHQDFALRFLHVHM